VAFDGSADQAFVEAVRRNIDHGLPLTIADRSKAGEHLLQRHPDWSDRRIAEVCGLSPHTIARLRSEAAGGESSKNGKGRGKNMTSASAVTAPRTTATVGSRPGRPGLGRTAAGTPAATSSLGPAAPERIVELGSRLGRDGKTRPAQPGLLRDRVVDAIRANPSGSLRQIASVAKVSPETVRRIRKEIDQPAAPDMGILAALRAPAECDTDWREDPALGANAELLSWLDRTDPAGDLQEFALGVPLSRVYELADEARRRAGRWAAFAEVLENRARACTRGYSLA
jgi:AraC-like DNA-binding protein